MTVDPLKHPRAELKAAENALQAMRTAQSFDKFEEEWRSFLNYLEKVWVKAERACQHIQNQFLPWQGEFSRLRKKDMLLRYLKQARDADNHSIQEVVEHKPGIYSFSLPGGPGGVRIDRLRTGPDGRVIEYVGSHRPTIIDEPPQINVVPVKNKALSELGIEANYIESMVLPKEVNHASQGFYRVTRTDQTTHAGTAEATISAVDRSSVGRRAVLAGSATGSGRLPALRRL